MSPSQTLRPVAGRRREFGACWWPLGNTQGTAEIRCRIGMPASRLTMTPFRPQVSVCRDKAEFSGMSGQGNSAAAYFELPGERRQPFWQLGLFVLLVLGVHLGALFAAFGVVSRSSLPQALPVLTVRVLAPAPPMVKVEEARKVEPAKTAKEVEPPAAVTPARPVEPPRKMRPTKPARASTVRGKKVPATPVAVLTAAVTAPAPSAFAVASQPASPAVAAPPPAATSPAVVGARFDADYLRNPAPVYPQTSRRLGEEGRVVLRIRVSAEGLPLDIEIRHSSGFRRLDEAARAAVEHWRFVPARRGETAIESSVLVPLQFTLKD